MYFLVYFLVFFHSLCNKILIQTHKLFYLNFIMIVNINEITRYIFTRGYLFSRLKYLMFVIDIIKRRDKKKKIKLREK